MSAQRLIEGETFSVLIGVERPEPQFAGALAIEILHKSLVSTEFRLCNANSGPFDSNCRYQWKALPIVHNVSNFLKILDCFWLMFELTHSMPPD